MSGMTIEREMALVKQAKVDAEAFGKIYDIYFNKIYNYIYYRVGNHYDAEDLTEQTFYRALEKIETYTCRNIRFSAWLYRIAHNVVANWYRSRSRHKEVSLEDLTFPLPYHHDLHRAVERDEAILALQEAIRSLPDDRQLLLILKFLEGKTNAEVGEVMDKTEGAVKALYWRTLEALRKTLLEMGWEEDETEEDEIEEIYYEAQPYNK